jgi:DNA uptake protein ComE-like DNA-binding protein
LKAYFNFTDKERLGLVVLSVVLIIMVIVFNVGYRQTLPEALTVDAEQLEMIPPLESQLDYTSQESVEKDGSNVITPFNPNKLTLNEWMDLGFSEKQANSILNYKNNYGPFQKKEDVHKLYVVSDEMYEKIESYMFFDKKSNDKIEIKPDNEDLIVETPLLSLNSASDSDLMKLPHIGPVYAQRIIKYRNKIGGFVDERQIQTIYVSDEAKKSLIDNTFIDYHQIHKVNINTAEKNELKNIPGSNWEVIAIILKKRDQAPLTNLDCIPEKLLPHEEREIFLKYVNF